MTTSDSPKVERRQISLPPRDLEKLEKSEATQEAIADLSDVAFLLDYVVQNMHTREQIKSDAGGMLHGGFSIELSEVGASSRFKNDPRDRLLKALEPLIQAKLLEIEEVKSADGGSGRPSKIINLSYTFNSDAWITNEWQKLVDSVVRNRKVEFDKQMMHTLGQQVWVAKKHFFTNDPQNSSLPEFMPGEVVPTRIVQIMGTSAIDKVEPLGARRIVTCPCPCKRSFPVDMERLPINPEPRSGAKQRVDANHIVKYQHNVGNP